MLKTHKIALNPNNVQATQFAQHCGYARVAYNHALSDFKAGLDTSQWRSHIELCRRFNAIEQYDWCSGMSQNVSKNAIYTNLKDAIGRWQSGQNRFPKFKKRSHGQSFQADSGRGTITVVGQRIKLPKIGWVRMFQSLRFLGTICKVVISKQGHRWFASILVDTFVDDTPPEIRGLATVGVDVGIKHLTVTSDRTYHCSACGHTQDRDLNAAINLRTLAVGHTER